jgi:hypothetical protein
MDASSPHHQRLLVMPDDGVAAVVELIDAASRQLLLKQFKLQSEAVMGALLRAQDGRCSAGGCACGTVE